MNDPSSEIQSYPPNSADMRLDVVESILDDARAKGLIGELTDRSVSLFFCERGVRDWVDKGLPFTASMVAQRMPVEPLRGHLGLVIGWLSQARLIKRTGAVFAGYPEDESGRATCLWEARLR